ncbi:MAG: zinc ribbon domain-containing protein [Coriobacteriia bacterium]|nr:zinc ribbon domain-containing protein [Coriobacteriia bacterium]
MKYCPECGTSVEGQKFCSECGYKLGYITAPKEPKLPAVPPPPEELSKPTIQPQQPAAVQQEPIATQEVAVDTAQPEQPQPPHEDSQTPSINLPPPSGSPAEEFIQQQQEGDNPPLATDSSSSPDYLPPQDEFTDFYAFAKAPVLRTWKTSVGFSLLAVFIGFPVVVLLLNMISLPFSFISSALPIVVAPCIFSVLIIIYAAKFYPSYFTDKPKFKSSRVISFLNLLFGSVIFGVLWNSSLTKKVEGRSHKYLVGLTIFFLFWMVIGVPAGMLLGVGSTSQPQSSSPANRIHPDNSVVEITGNSSAETTGMRTYIDNETGATFRVPPDWVEAPLTQDGTTIDIKFFYSQERYEELVVMYGSFDLWSQMTEAEVAGLKPSDIDTFFYTKSEFAEIVSVPANELEMVTIGNNSFYKCTPSEYSDLAQSVVVLFCIDNGFLYTLSFLGYDQHFGDFETLAASLVFSS